MVYARFMIGLLIVIVALWIIVGEQLSGASADATINARVATVRAPVAGELGVPGRALGSRVARGETVASVTDPLVDGVRLDDLGMEVAFAEAEVARQQAEIAETEALLAALGDRRDIYRAERIAEIGIRLAAARERLALIEAGAGGGGSEAALPPPTDADVERPPLEPQLPELWLSYARERVEVLEVALRAAEAGVFLGDGYNDAPFAEQRMTDLRSALAAAQAALREADDRLTAVTTRRDIERLRVNRASGGEIASPADGLYWEVLAADGVTVQRGDPIARILDCGSVMVTASVTEAVYNRLQPGDQVTFRPRGGSRTFDGTVDRLAGAGAATVYRELAVAPSQRHLERHDVLIEVPGLLAEDDLACAVGRTGRVFFEPRPLDWLRGLWN